MTLDVLRVTVAGEPVAQGRGQAANIPGVGIRVRDPKKSREWKTRARGAYLLRLEELQRAAPAFPPGVALDVYIVAVFELPKSHRRRVPVQRRRKLSKPDGSNITKAVEDAGNEVLWPDDSQIARVTVEKWVGAQGERPAVYVTVRAL